MAPLSAQPQTLTSKEDFVRLLHNVFVHVSLFVPPDVTSLSVNTWLYCSSRCQANVTGISSKHRLGGGCTFKRVARSGGLDVRIPNY